jgi:hypothetical protein
MQRFLLAFAVASLLVAAISISSIPAQADCEAPYTGCLAACGNKVTTSSQPKPTVPQQVCFDNCKAQYNKCKGSRGGGHHHY